MNDTSPHAYVIQGRGQRDYADCVAALAKVPARTTVLPFIGDEDELISRTRDADALVTSASPITRGVMSALEGLKTVVRTGVGVGRSGVQDGVILAPLVIPVPIAVSVKLLPFTGTSTVRSALVRAFAIPPGKNVAVEIGRTSTDVKEGTLELFLTGPSN